MSIFPARSQATEEGGGRLGCRWSWRCAGPSALGETAQTTGNAGPKPESSTQQFRIGKVDVPGRVGVEERKEGDEGVCLADM